jgi:hypothetical protein
MPIFCVCPNGHQFAVHVRFAGVITTCRKCGERVQVPRTDDGLSDTGILSILGDFEPSDKGTDPPPSKKQLPERECPRCHRSVPVVLRTCPKCNVYLPPLENGMVAG